MELYFETGKVGPRPQIIARTTSVRAGISPVPLASQRLRRQDFFSTVSQVLARPSEWLELFEGAMATWRLFFVPIGTQQSLQQRKAARGAFDGLALVALRLSRACRSDGGLASLVVHRFSGVSSCGSLEG
ncbi:hypothetical protein BN2476_90020 [Paraburkholderia piptadeniae]|uniref:Uncharacterized protein n=1 Tax=Paraburkholderia piptadeniae TaxID=1701573 RepID=A0A1N7RML4_9BURK|nr:hypothetical protein BN2476_90020 [Paraburkholderia piptadeniae]